jgi:hypothetical protein
MALSSASTAWLVGEQATRLAAASNAKNRQISQFAKDSTSALLHGGGGKGIMALLALAMMPDAFQSFIVTAS